MCSVYGSLLTIYYGILVSDQCETLLRPDRTRTLGHVNAGPAPLAAAGHVQYIAFEGTDHLNSMATEGGRYADDAEALEGGDKDPPKPIFVDFLDVPESVGNDPSKLTSEGQRDAVKAVTACLDIVVKLREHGAASASKFIWFIGFIGSRGVRVLCVYVWSLLLFLTKIILVFLPLLSPLPPLLLPPFPFPFSSPSSPSSSPASSRSFLLSFLLRYVPDRSPHNGSIHHRPPHAQRPSSGHSGGPRRRDRRVRIK